MAFVGDLSLPSTPPQLKAPNPATRDSRRKTLINARLWKRKNLEEFYKIETNGTATPQLLHWLSPAGSRTPRLHGAVLLVPQQDIDDEVFAVGPTYETEKAAFDALSDRAFKGGLPNLLARLPPGSTQSSPQWAATSRTTVFSAFVQSLHLSPALDRAIEQPVESIKDVAWMRNAVPSFGVLVTPGAAPRYGAVLTITTRPSFKRDSKAESLGTWHLEPAFVSEAEALAAISLLAFAKGIHVGVPTFQHTIPSSRPPPPTSPWEAPEDEFEAAQWDLRFDKPGPKVKKLMKLCDPALKRWASWLFVRRRSSSTDTATEHPWSAFLQVGSRSGKISCYCVLGDPVSTAFTAAEDAAELALKDIKDPAHHFKADPRTCGPAATEPPWFQANPGKVPIADLPTSLTQVLEWIKTYTKWDIEPSSLFNTSLRKIGLRDGEVEPGRAVETLAGRHAASCSVRNMLDPTRNLYASIIAIGYGSLTRNLHFFVPPVFSTKEDATIAVCYLTLFPGCLEDLLKILETHFTKAEWHAGKNEYVKKQLKMMQQECRVLGVPEPGWDCEQTKDQLYRYWFDWKHPPVRWYGEPLRMKIYAFASAVLRARQEGAMELLSQYPTQYRPQGELRVEAERAAKREVERMENEKKEAEEEAAREAERLAALADEIDGEELVFDDEAVPST